ncbi:hypothetical protein EDD85DRAFT_930986 [Armillaria nabsnona]|nr:hypothetical protein EDD85DRAFT_930986 [Armillaria nabsnona]
MSLHRHLRPDTDAALALPALPLTIYNDYSDANKTRKYSTPVNEIEYPNKSTQIWKNTVAIASVKLRLSRVTQTGPNESVYSLQVSYLKPGPYTVSASTVLTLKLNIGDCTLVAFACCPLPTTSPSNEWEGLQLVGAYLKPGDEPPGSVCSEFTDFIC